LTRANTFDGTWLVSNDLIRSIIRAKEGTTNASKVERALDHTGISLINSYIGLALCTICNASSRGTNSFGDFDAREMNGSLGAMYVTAFAHARRDPGVGLEGLMFHMASIIERAFCNPTIVEGQLQGLSVPTDESELVAIRGILNKRYQSLGDFQESMSGLATIKKPRMFTSARRIVAMLGQPQGAQRNLELEQLAKTAVSAMFDNSDISWFKFEHSGDLDFLVTFIVDPWLPVVAESMFYYVMRTWLSPQFADLEKLVEAANGNSESLSSIEMQMYEEDEDRHLENSPLASLELPVDGAVPFTRSQVIASLRKLGMIYTWKKAKKIRVSN